MQKEHQTELEEKVKPQECFFCRQMYPSLRDLQEHELESHKNDTIKCEICGGSSGTKFHMCIAEEKYDDAD